MSRPTVPPPSDDDHEDVAWALRAASAQWRREDQADAISWVRRAAETAVEVGQPMRARDLFQLANYLEGGPMPDSMRSVPPPVAPPSMAPPVFPSFSPGSSAPPFSHPSLSGPPSFAAAFGGHPPAIAPPPPSFGGPQTGGGIPDVEYVDDVDDIDDIVDVDDDDDDFIEEEFLDDEDEETVLIEDEVEELDEAPPPSRSSGYGSSGYGSSGYGSSGHGGGLSDLPSPVRSASEPSTRYRSDPPQVLGLPPGLASQFPSQVPTRASARAFSSRPARPLSSRPGARGPASSRPSGPLPPLPSLGPAGGLTPKSTPPGQSSSVPASPSSRPGGSWPSEFGTESEPIVPARTITSAPPAARRTRTGQRPLGGGFDEAFLDSLEDEDAPPARRRGPRPKVTFHEDEAETFDAELDTRGRGIDAELGELDFGRSPSSQPRKPLPSVPDLPSMGVGPAPSKLPLDASTAAEYAQHSRQGPFEHHDDIEQELGVDLSLGTSRARRFPGARSASDFSPTPGRVSVRPTALGLGEPPKTSGHQPYPMAPSASAPPVAPIEPPSHPSQAPPPESMSEPDAEFDETDRRSYELTGQVYGDHVELATPPPAVEDLDDDDDILADAFQRLQSTPPEQRSSAPPSAQAALSSRAPASMPHGRGTSVDGTDLMDVPGLQDLPEDGAAILASRARIIDLSPGEEVSDFGVALVTRGAVQLMPTIADASCVLARQGDVLFTRGTMAGDISLRVVGAEPGSRVAVFSERDLEIATSSCPWVADELAEVADRYNAFGGAVLGPLGESLDEMFRMMVFAKCTVKNPAAGTLIAEAGKPMDGMYVLGSGTLEVVSPSGSVTARLSPGDFVFPETLLSAGAARATVRVPATGALVLYADRMSAHELLATCPPFIEILAGA